MMIVYRFNGETPMRELEQWMPDGSEDNMVDLESGGSNSNGWSAHEMFAKNKEFGVETSYDPNMSGYTTQLSRNSADSAEYRERERKAALIAAEIEGSTNSIAAVELENGDEEEAFSAVVRDKNSPGDKQGAYIPPGRRDQGVPRGSGGRGRGVRTTPPAQNDYDRRYDRSYSGNRGGYNNDRGGDRYDRDRGGYNNDYRDRGYNNRDNRDNRGHDNRDRGGYKKTEEKKASPLPEHEKQVTGDARRKSGENRSPEQENNSHRLGKKSREQQQNELKEFHDTFKLESVPRVSVKGQGGSQHSTPLPSPQPAETAPAAQLSPAAPADLAPAVSPAGAAAPDSVKKSTLNPLAKEFSLNPSAKEFTPRGPSSGPVSRVNPTPPRPQTPNTPNSNNMAAMAQAQAGIPQVIFYKHMFTLLIYFLSFSGFQSRLLNHWTRRSHEPHECEQRDVCPRPASSPHDPGSWGSAHAGQYRWRSTWRSAAGLQTWSRSAARSGSQWQGCQQWRSR